MKNTIIAVIMAMVLVMGAGCSSKTVVEEPMPEAVQVERG